MHSPLLAELRQRRLAIQSRWGTLLRAEPVTSPLANPESLVHLIEATIEDVFSMLEAGGSAQDGAMERTEPRCTCGRNPLLAFFAAGRQALHEGLVLSQAALAPFDPEQRDIALAELNQAIDELHRREIEAFCGLCQLGDAHRAPAFATA